MPRTIEEKRAAQREATRRYTAKNHESVLEKNRKWRKRNPEKVSIYRTKYRQDNAERMAAYEKVRYAKDPDSAKKRAAEWREHNQDRLHEYYRQRYRDNAEEMKAQYKQWRAENKDKLRQRFREWSKANPEKVRLYGHERRAILRGSGGKIAPEEIAELWSNQNGRCVYFSVCGNVLVENGRNAMQRDHIHPLRPKDRTVAPGRNEISNIQLLCGSCNRKKKNQDPYQFTQAYEGRLFPDLPQSDTR